MSEHMKSMGRALYFSVNYYSRVYIQHEIRRAELQEYTKTLHSKLTRYSQAIDF